jgi:trimeric autotransporter adhesin
MKSLFFIFFSVLFLSKANAQSLAINTDGSTANASSILDVKSTDKGVLIPRMNKTERNAIGSPATGLLVFVNAPDTVGFSYYNGSSWVWIASGNYATDTTAWKLTGNSNATSQTFVGTTNDTALRFRIRNIQSGIIDSSTQNTALGYEALRISSNPGTANTAFGFGAGKLQSTGTSNVIMGRNALSATGSSSQNVAIGDSAMGNAIWSFGNTAVGYQTLKNLDGRFLYTFNTAIGYASQNAATGNTDPTVSSLNTSVGGYSMADNVTGKNNTAIGVSALRFNDSSANNTAIGMNALAYHKRNGDSYNVAVGTSALERDIIGVWNTAIGAEAMRYATRSTLNSAIGFRTLKLIIDGGENNTLGVGTMEYKDTALSCVAIGRFALSGSSSFNNSPDTGSIAIGTRAGRFNNANYNTFIGYESGIGNPSNPLGITGAETVSIGAYSLNKLQSGASNSTFGYAALFNNVLGSKNIGIGGFSLYNVNASGNIGIGYDAGTGVTSGSNNIFVGNNSGGTLNVSNKLFIENSNADKDNALIYGDFAADSLNLNADVTIRDFARLGSISSGAPAIKMKKILVPAGPAVNGNANYLFGGGITDSKIIGVNVLMTYSGTTKIPPGYIDVAGYEYNIQVQFNGITVINKNGNSANIGGKPISILITYEE